MGSSEGHQSLAEGKQILVGCRPVEPGDFVILTVRIVVALLRPADLVPTEQHGDAEGKKQGGEHRAGLASPKRQDSGIIGRALSPTIPRPVVVGAVTVRLPVRDRKSTRLNSSHD